MSETDPEIDVTEAVKIAKRYIATTFVDEKISNIALEEVRFDDVRDEWQLTIGFSFPWEQPRVHSAQLLADFRGDVLETRRTYKKVRVSRDGKVLDVSIRTL